MSGEEEQKLAIQYFQQAYSRQMQGELDEAVELYKKSIELLPTAEAYTFLGWTYSFLGRYDEAITECRQAIVIDPEFGNPYNDIGAYLIEQGALEEATPGSKRRRERRATTTIVSLITTWAGSMSASASGGKPRSAIRSRSSTTPNTRWHRPLCAACKP
jgi:Flp pilus assembly protein TadD